jgi:putative methyltransferase (TIGR04325 family)
VHAGPRSLTEPGSLFSAKYLGCNRCSTRIDRKRKMVSVASLHAGTLQMKLHFAPLLRTGPMRNALQCFAGTSPGYRLLNRLSGSSGIFHTFAEARLVAAGLGMGGHDEPTQSNVYSHVFRQSDYPIVYWLSRLAPRRLFDFGGALGNLYYLYRDYIDVSGFEWLVYDLPEVIERGRERAAREHVTNVRFTADLSEGCDCDVLLTSGALHYWEQSLSTLFANLNERPRHVLINRSPMTDNEQYIVIQKLPQVALPCVVRNRARLIRDFEHLGYTFVDEWVEPTRGLTVPLFPRYDVKEYFGFYFRRADAADRPRE